MSERIQIEFTTGNAAFAESPTGEIARILRSLAERVESGMVTDETPIRDINGNRVGTMTIRADREG